MSKKYVWQEGEKAYAVYASLVEEKDGFLTLRTEDGRTLLINRNFLIKVESGARP